MDVGRRRSSRFSPSEVCAEVRKRMVAGATSGLGRRPVMLLALTSALAAAAWIPFWQEWQHFFTSRTHVGIEVVGWLFCVWSIAAMIGAELVIRLEWTWTHRATYMALTQGLIGLALAGAGLAGSHIGLAIAMAAIANLVGGAMLPVYKSWYNEQIEGDNRATLLSFQTTFETFGGTTGLPLQGLIADAYGTGVAWQFGGILAIFQVPIFLALGRHRDSEADPS
jgi:predicted MFS family arabinose efflux permease